VEPSWLTRPEVRRAAEKVTRHTRARSLQRLVGGAIRMGPASNFPYKHHEHIQRTCSQGKADGAGRMAMETNQLVQCLVAEVEPVRRLSPPWRRSLLWLNLSLLYIAGGGGIPPVARGGRGPIGPPLVLEQAAMLATAVTAAIAAFSSVVPGRDRRCLLAPLIPFSVWLVTLGQGCLHDWQTHGPAGLLPGSDLGRAVPPVILSIPPPTARVRLL